jgi:hypothetical protein
MMHGIVSKRGKTMNFDFFYVFFGGVMGRSPSASSQRRHTRRMEFWIPFLIINMCIAFFSKILFEILWGAMHACMMLLLPMSVSNLYLWGAPLPTTPTHITNAGSTRNSAAHAVESSSEGRT